MTPFIQQKVTLNISPTAANGMLYIAISPIKTTQEQDLIL